MKSVLFNVRKSLILGVATLGCVFAFGSFNQAQAGWEDYYRHNPGRRANYGHSHNHGHHRHSGPIYHGPSLHYDTYYHHDYSHWTPGRGWHSHGHYHTVPHYTPGHFDYKHGNHIHGNPWYH